MKRINTMSPRAGLPVLSHLTLACWTTVLVSSLLPATLQAQAMPAPPVSPTPVVNYEYDAVGNPTKTVVAPGVSGLGLSTVNTYDNLQRRKDTTDAKAGKTQFGYDGADRLTKVTDPRNLVTQYARNGLGDNTQLVSPDTGTAGHTFDAAGNLKTRTDSRGVLSTHTYDALNRPTQVVHSKTGSPSETHSWGYDLTGTNYGAGKGRLSRTDHPTGATRYIYDPQGRITSDFQRINPATGANPANVVKSVLYTYSSAGNVTSITYPSGRRLTVGYNAGGQPTTLSLAANATGAATALISNIQWEPFGAPRSWDWQMATGTQAQSWSYDTNGRLTRYRLGDRVRDLTYDAADRITAYTHYNAATAAAVPSLNQSFSYDELGRISSSTVGTSTTAITYDANGNRVTSQLNTTASNYTTPATNNRLTATTNPARTITYDNAGNPTGITGAAATAYTATYNLAGRLATLTKAGATTTYAYDNDGRRIRKFISSGTGAGAASTVIFAYDQNDQLIGEYSSTGTAIREYVWLGNMPIAIFTPDTVATNPPVVYYVHTDHLNTPRVVVNKANQIRWRWLAEPFGTTAPETNPASLGVFTQPLRFPGQYADSESGLYYNHWRYFDPQTGRYTTSDHIGLVGGVNTYSYVDGNPVSYIDPTGEFAWGLAFAGVDLAWQLYQNGGNLKCVNWADVGLSALGGGLLNALGKGAFRFKRGAEWVTKNGKPRNPHSWDATSKWMNKEGIQKIEQGQHRHHWLLERNQGIGKNRPDWLKNQPWNTNPISSELNNWLSRRPALAPLGAPSWVPEVAGGGAAAIFGGDCECQ